MAKIEKLKKKNFTIVSNKIVRDEGLSWKARGIFLYLYSQDNDWDFYEVEVAKHATDGRDSLRSGLIELEERGYLKRKRTRNERGQVTNSDWIITDEPILEKPMLENPTQVNPTQENPTLRNTNKRNTNERSTNSKNTNVRLPANKGVSVSQLEDDFEKLWKLYPKKVGKPVAFAKYKKAIKAGTTNKEIQDGIVAYKNQIEANGTDKQYIKNGSTWFNQQGWTDEFEVDIKQSAREQKHQEATDVYGF